MGKMKRLILNTSLFYIGAVFGLVIGLAIGQLGIFVTIGKAVYDARCEQYQEDRAIFYGEQGMLKISCDDAKKLNKYINDYLADRRKNHKKVMARKTCHWERINEQFCGKWTEQTCNSKVHAFDCEIPDYCPDCKRKTREVTK
jgi:hypothetical protein